MRSEPLIVRSGGWTLRGDLVAPAILPVIYTGLPIHRPGLVLKCATDVSGHIQRLGSGPLAKVSEKAQSKSERIIKVMCNGLNSVWFAEGAFSPPW